MTQASSFRVGRDASTGDEVYAPLKNLLPMADPSSIKLSGWDISGARLGDAMRRAGVLDYDLQRQLYDELQAMPAPLPGAYFPDFIAANQAERADNVLPSTMGKQAQLERLRADIVGC